MNDVEVAADQPFEPWFSRSFRLKDKGYLDDNKGQGELNYKITAKTEKVIRSSALEEIFGKLRKDKKGNHSTDSTGTGLEQTARLP